MSHRDFEEPALEQQPKKILLFWKSDPLKADVPRWGHSSTEGVCACCDLPCATAHPSQTRWFSSTWSHLCVLAQHRHWVLLLRPCRHLWHTDCSHLPNHFRSRLAMGDIHSQAGRAACLPCRTEGCQGPAAGISQEHPLLQGQDIRAVSLRTAQNVPERKGDLHFMLPAQPHLPCTPLRDSSSPLHLLKCTCTL